MGWAQWPDRRCSGAGIFLSGPMRFFSLQIKASRLLSSLHIIPLLGGLGPPLAKPLQRKRSRGIAQPTTTSDDQAVSLPIPSLYLFNASFLASL